MDRIKTAAFPCVGGLISNQDYLQQGRVAPGSAIDLINFEPSTAGGYTRILGYSKFDDDTVPGSDEILGAFVFGDDVIACRGTGIYKSTGAGWTAINGADTRTGATIYRSAQFDFSGTTKIILVDGVNDPVTYTTSGTYTVLTAAPAGAEHVAAYKGRIWFAKDNIVTSSAPLDETDYDVANGAVEINVANEVTGLKEFRDTLIVFCRDKILRITGDTEDDFVLKPVVHTFGCIQSDSIIEANGDLYYLGPDGIRTFAATDRNDDFNLFNVAKQIQDNVTALKNTYGRIVAVPIKTKSQIRFFGYDENTPAAQSEGILGALQSAEEGQAWAFSELVGIKANVVKSGLTTNGNERIVFGNDDGYIYVMESSNSFDGTDITYLYRTPYLSFEDVNQRKSFRKIKAFMRSSSEYNIITQLTLDFDLPRVIQPNPTSMVRTSVELSLFGSAIFGSSAFGGTTVPYGEASLIGSGFSGSLGFSGTNSLPPFTIQSLALEASFYGRK